MTNMTESPPRLTDPDERPGADVVIYDGQCKFCRRQVERLAAWDKSDRLSYLSLHDVRVSQRYPDLSHETLMRQMYVVTTAGSRHGGAAAIRYLSRRLPRLWWLAPVMHLPGSLPFWQWGYRFVARQRYRFGKIEDCENGTCSLHHR